MKPTQFEIWDQKSLGYDYQPIDQTFTEYDAKNEVITHGIAFKMNDGDEGYYFEIGFRRGAGAYIKTWSHPGVASPNSYLGTINLSELMTLKKLGGE